MLRLLLDISNTVNSRFSKRIGLRKKIYSIITEAMITTTKENMVGLFSHGSIIDKELTALFVAYKKNYNLNTQTMITLCEGAASIIEDLCYVMNERAIYCANLYNDINRRKFVDKILSEAFKDD